jgi:alpha-tubulin suppressor-like RCC1 family protein
MVVRSRLGDSFLQAAISEAPMYIRALFTSPIGMLLSLPAFGLLSLASAPAEATPLKARAVSAGEYHACAILRDRRIKCWGRNDLGQLGLEDREDRGDESGEMGNALPFVDLGPDVQVRQLALGRSHSCALYGENFVKCWGSNEYGQLGLGDTQERGANPDDMGNALPQVRITEDQRITSIVAGSQHTCALLEDGTVRCWGRNQQGQLGLGHEETFGDDWEELIPDAVVDVGQGRTVLQLDAGFAHTCALLDDLSVKCWGWNDYGQLGIGSTFERGDSAFEMGVYLQAVDFGGVPGFPAQVTTGAHHTCVLFDTGYVRCFGEGDEGALGVGNPNTIGDETTDVLHKADLGWGMEPVSAVSAGGYHNCALTANGIGCWGMNAYGQLGNGRGDNEDVGEGSFDMGVFLDVTDTGRPVVSHVESGWLFTCARFWSERIKCWGHNGYGQLGLGDDLDRGVNEDEMGDALPNLDLGNDGQRF